MNMTTGCGGPLLLRPAASDRHSGSVNVRPNLTSGAGPASLVWAAALPSVAAAVPACAGLATGTPAALLLLCVPARSCALCGRDTLQGPGPSYPELPRSSGAASAVAASAAAAAMLQENAHTAGMDSALPAV